MEDRDAVWRGNVLAAEGLAEAWQTEELASGDVVIVQLPNCYEFVLTHLALTRLNAVTLAVPINYRATELEVIASTSHAKAVVCNPPNPACAGDLGYFDEDGLLRCEGRLKDLIIRGGVNISSGEVEELVRAHPEIEGVAVVDVADPRLGERVGAVVVPATSGERVPGTEELSVFLTERGLARNKHPEHIVVVDSLPRTPASKVQKFILRESFKPEPTA